MRKSVFAVALAMAGTVSLAQVGAGRRAPILLDGVGAYINDSTITISEVMAEVRRMPNLSRNDEARMREMYYATLNAMIDRRLILDYAKKTKVQLQPWAVEARIREIVSQSFDGDRTKLYDLLADRKIATGEWEKGLEEDLLLSAMRYQYVDRRVTVTPSEIRAEYEANKSRYQTESAVGVSMIVLDASEDTHDGTVEQCAEAIFASLKDGVSFATLARRYSKDSKAISGGSWGKINPEEVFHEDLAKIVRQLKPGEVSPLVQMKDVGYIVRKDEQQDMRVLTFEEASRYVEGRLRVEKSEKMFKEWTARLRKEAYISIFELPEAR